MGIYLEIVFKVKKTKVKNFKIWKLIELKDF